MDKQYDIIVIGAGNGGLSAAASACSRGFKTLLIEQHNLPGGFATSFRRGRFEFEPALHELCDVGEPDQREEVGALIDSYGAKVNWVKLPEAYRLIINGEGEERIDAVMPFGKQAFIDKMEEYVPGSRESMEKFFYLADCIMAANAAVAKAGGKADPKVMMKEHPVFLKCANYPTAVVLRKLKMPLKAQKILSAYWCYMGVNMEDLEFGFYASLVHKYIVNAAYIPRYRSHELSGIGINPGRRIDRNHLSILMMIDFVYKALKISGNRPVQSDPEDSVHTDVCIRKDISRLIERKQTVKLLINHRLKEKLPTGFFELSYNPDLGIKSILQQHARDGDSIGSVVADSGQDENPGSFLIRVFLFNIISNPGTGGFHQTERR